MENNSESEKLEKAPEAAPTPETKRVKVKKHVGRNKKKYGVAAIVTLIITLLEMYPNILHLIKTGDPLPLATFGKTKLGELQDAGFDF